MTSKIQFYVVNRSENNNTIVLDIIGIDNRENKIAGKISVMKMNLKEFQSHSEFLKIVPCNEIYGISVINYDTYYSIDVVYEGCSDSHPWYELDKVKIDDPYTSDKYGKIYFGLPSVVYLHMIGQVCGEL